MKRNWIQCVPGEGLGRWRVPQATMDRRGDIMMSRVTWELLGEPEAVLVFFERESQLIGIKPAYLSTPNHFPAIEHGRHGGRRIRAHNLRNFANSTNPSFQSPENPLDQPNARQSHAQPSSARQSHVGQPNTIRFTTPTLDDSGTLILNRKTAHPAYNSK